MNKFTLKQIVLPFITAFILYLIWFGPINFRFLGNILASLVVFLASYIEYKRKGFSSLGFQRKNLTLKNFFVLAPLVALVLFVSYVFVLLPLITKLTGVPVDVSSFDEIKGNFPTYIFTLLIVWVGSGFGEEIIFRGYFMRQFIKFFGEGKISVALSIIVTTGVFGFMHIGQGITGQILSFVTGSLIALIFYFRKYDLWFVCSVHGFFNTIGLTCIYFGLQL
mgnify:CR=1 FL=1